MSLTNKVASEKLPCFRDYLSDLAEKRDSDADRQW